MVKTTEEWNDYYWKRVDRACKRLAMICLLAGLGAVLAPILGVLIGVWIVGAG
jgi:hypothetical protein